MTELDADIGVPTGTAGLALIWAELAAARATDLTGSEHVVDRDRLLGHLLLPLLAGDHLAGSPPRPAPAGGFVHADVIDDDEPLYAALVEDHAGADSEALAALAQECRLPVVPYRAWRAPDVAGISPPAASAPAASAPAASASERRVRPGEVTVVDLTAMWAGPLCAMLLAGWGADVITVESRARPDGLRGRPAQFAALDHGKRRLDLDLRCVEDRTAFERIIAGADVVLESFSPRVMANFGYSPAELRRHNPRVATVSLRAFPSTSPMHDWLGYGRGAHAASGLGLLDGRPQRARFAYPDPIAGLVAFATVLDVLGRTHPPRSAEVSLAGVIEPLVALGERPLGSGQPQVLDRLRAAFGTDPGPPIARTA
ncbi:MAG: CoA transferase [Ilumatobacteraceae bacterium]